MEILSNPILVALEYTPVTKLSLCTTKSKIAKLLIFCGMLSNLREALRGIPLIKLLPTSL